MPSEPLNHDVRMRAPLRPLFALFRLSLVATMVTCLLAACTVGPDFVRPSPPDASGYVPASQALHLDLANGEAPQQLVTNQPIPADWWRLFGSEALDRVVRQALADNPSIEVARATLAQSQQALAQARGAYYPEMDFAAGAERQRGPAFALGLLPAASGGLPLFNLYTVGPSVSYSPDVFGLTARLVEQQQALSEIEGYQLAAAHLAIAGNVVSEALIIASTRRQIEAVKAVIEDDQRHLALARDRFTAGRTNESDVLLAQTQFASDRSLLPPLEQLQSVAQDALALLVGKSPADWVNPDFDLVDFSLPANLPVSLPSALVEQRPDIRAAEAAVHARSAAIGVATAQMYPSFPLSASIDSAALATTSLFEQKSLVWTLSGGLAMPIFHGGALKAQKEGAIEAFHASLATYRQTVLQAFGQVADTLRALAHDAQLVDDQRHAFDAASGSLELQRRTYAAGRTGLLQLLDAERSVQQAQLGYARAQAQRFLDSAALFVAMGGGWWEDPDLCANCRQESGASFPGSRAASTPQTEGVKN